LHRNGHFDWEHWVRVFSRHVEQSPPLPGESVNDAYYRQWMAALEQIVIEKGLVAAGHIASRAEEWETAYLNTPHGLPVALDNAVCPPRGVHEVAPHGRPIAVFAPL
jgi:nitrile hydratase accessory protein